MDDAQPPLHILILTDRDWTHPQGGGTGTNLLGHVSRWLDWGHRVTILASAYPGAERLEHDGRLAIHRMGRLKTAVPRIAFRQWRGLVPDADVVLEVVNGVTFLTPLWLRTPHVTLMHHLSGPRQYTEEFGHLGRPAAFLAETTPLRWLYRGTRFVTISQASAGELAGLGIPAEDVEVVYLGIEQDEYGPGERAPEPTLLYLGRLKRYKRLDLLLDVIEALPEAVLDLAGEGDHRPELEREIERRGLAGRVRLHGFVDDETKLSLLRGAWVNVTASSAEGWGLTVIEAGACGTPSVALSTGGLAEAIEDGRTGLLAHDGEQLTREVQRVVRDPELRERLGTAALARARAFTWERAAERTLGVLRRERERGGTEHPLRRLARSDTGRALGLAGAAMTANIIALVFTVVFARLLGASGYGSLAALVSAFLILSIPGSALQVTVAREVSHAMVAGHEVALGASVRSWMRSMAIATLAAAAGSVLLRAEIAAAIGVDLEWAAAATVPFASAWLLLSIMRGVLQGTRGYRLVGLSLIGEAAGRLALGLVLVAAGLGATGAFLGGGAAVLAMILILSGPLHRHLAGGPQGDGLPRRRLRDLVAMAWPPILALALIAVLQNIDVIVVKHQATSDDAGSYAAASVAAKTIVWVAVGLGLYLVPEAARRATAGIDGRPVLSRMISLVLLCAVPMVLVFAVAGKPLLGAVFGAGLVAASGALPWLALAMTLLSCAYLSVLYLLAHRRTAFLWALAAAAVLEPLLLWGLASELTEFALALMALQFALAASVLALSLRRPPRVA